ERAPCFAKLLRSAGHQCSAWPHLPARGGPVGEVQSRGRTQLSILATTSQFRPEHPGKVPPLECDALNCGGHRATRFHCQWGPSRRSRCMDSVGDGTVHRARKSLGERCECLQRSPSDFLARCTVPSPTESMHRERRSEEHTSELQSLAYLVCRLLLE